MVNTNKTNKNLNAVVDKAINTYKIQNVIVEKAINTDKN